MPETDARIEEGAGEVNTAEAGRVAAGGPDPAAAAGPPAAEAVAVPDDAAAVLAREIVAERRVAVEREHWLRRRFDKERRVTLAMLQLLIDGVHREHRATRFWRWLIDDFRSERRLMAKDEDPESEAALARIIGARLAEREAEAPEAADRTRSTQ
jgi:hypothetical protein